MATVPIIKCTSNERPADMKSTDEKNGERSDKKLTVLESHGYVLGKTIGAGSYATVKVIVILLSSKMPKKVYIVMEYAQNGSLFDVIRHDTYIDELRSRRWFRQLLEAIDYCHERGVVHRDIKCENLLMDQQFNVKLSDFGFARGQMKPKDGEWPLSMTYCGSYAYAAPEILRGIPYQAQLSDIWSMGVVLYAMVYGRLPFDETSHAILLKQVQSRVVFPKHPKVSQPCRSLIARILVPQTARMRICVIRTDAWLEMSVVAQTSINDGFAKTATVHPTCKEREASDEGVVSITPAILQRILNERPKATVDDKTETTKIDLNAKL
ncbi:testis-specific serine/threonine-protein kinase 3-like isoform X2 [Odontomachus brunneus]|uniref:testis-specific serine/threonine-protein kinase 3-like isoform X2 n=1 Tax=Odontomachus brunneus TaxID=486640 RepID=UPI0013F27874|nr:testis-specific serine/threonine-protein kinase 3-like isoform X2 [Odontomachus brunneus]